MLHQQLEQLSSRLRYAVILSFDPLPDEGGAGLSDEMLRGGINHHKALFLKPAQKGGFSGNWVCAGCPHLPTTTEPNSQSLLFALDFRLTLSAFPGMLLARWLGTAADATSTPLSLLFAP
jgi:hypothetical protein